MPCINVNIATGGPLLIVHIGISMPRIQALQAAGQPIPPPAKGTFLIDTGASCTCVDPALLAGLGIQPTGRVAIGTPSTAGVPHMCDQYDISIIIPGAPNGGAHVIGAIPVVETHLQSQGIDGLIGRDVLKDCTLIYNGTGGHFAIAY